MSPLNQAISIAGGVSLLASRIGVGQSAVSNWLARGGCPSPKNCVAIERVTSGKVTRQALRPDDWQEIWPELLDAKPQVA